jgi:3-hydroxyisobutyrate dehydrogenase-like beta-hydroxyacid dehydrogenase
MRVGVVGPGIMGGPMARNLLGAGHEVVVVGRTPARVDALVAVGARRAASPADLVRQVEVLLTSLPDGPDVEMVVAGPAGLLEGAASGQVVVDTSTIAPATARALAERCAAHGVAFLDAPVSGGERGAVEGTLSIMVGGDAAALARVRPVLAAIGRTVTHMGGAGQGQMTKLVNQVVGAVTLAAVAEGLTLAVHAGLDPDAVLAAVGSGAATSWQLQHLGPRLVRGDFAPGFMVRLQQKDLRLALAAAREVGVALPTSGLVHQLFAAVEARGGGALGTQALVTAIEALAARRG